MIARRIALFIPLLLLIAMLGLSQNKEYDQVANKAGVSIVKASFDDAFYESRHVRSDYADFTIQVKNIGTKSITAIDWHYIFVDSVRGNRLYDHLQFRTDDKRIKPGETKRLRKHIEGYFTPDYVRGRVRIMRVEYDDGSVWVRPKSNNH